MSAPAPWSVLIGAKEAYLVFLVITQMTVNEHPHTARISPPHPGLALFLGDQRMRQGSPCPMWTLPQFFKAPWGGLHVSCSQFPAALQGSSGL